MEHDWQGENGMKVRAGAAGKGNSNDRSAQHGRIRLLPVLLPLLLLACARESREPILARAGEKIITRAEFLQRAEFSPESRFRGSEAVRSGYLLDLLIDEKLAALEAGRAGLDSSAAVRRLTGFIEEMALARELYRKEVQRQVVLDSAQVERAAARQSESRRVAYIVFEDAALARRCQQQLEGGMAFGALLQEIYGAAADTSANRRIIRWGENEPVIEEAAWALLPGRTALVEVAGAFMVMLLEEVSRETVISETAAAGRLNLARRLLRSRQEGEISDRFVAALAHEQNLRFDKALVQEAAELLSRPATAPAAEDQNLPAERPLQPEILADARRLLADRLNQPVVSWRDGRLTLGEVLEKWQGYNFSVDQRTPRSRQRTVVRSISLLARDVMLAQAARQQGLADSQPVREEVRIWRDHYLALALQQQRESAGSGLSADWRHQLRQRYPVQVDTVMLRGIEISPLPFMALRTGQYNARVAPPWLYFQSDNPVQ